jgi:hypothetical protein
MAKPPSPFRDRYLVMAEDWELGVQHAELALRKAKSDTEREGLRRMLESWRALAADYRRLAGD